MSIAAFTDDTIWRDVKGYESLYKVSVDGDVMRVGGSVATKRGYTQSYPNKHLKQHAGQVYLSKDGKVKTFRVCNLVAEAFIEGYQKGDKVYHIEGSSDALSNLSLHPVLQTSSGDGDGWKNIPGYGGYYQASADGRIRSVDRLVEFKHYGKLLKQVRRGKELKLHLGKDGYLHCMISVNGKSNLVSVHRLVALAYIPNPDNKPQVDHIDGNKINNTVSNLRWITPKENIYSTKSL